MRARLHGHHASAAQKSRLKSVIKNLVAGPCGRRVPAHPVRTPGARAHRQTLQVA